MTFPCVFLARIVVDGYALVLRVFVRDLCPPLTGESTVRPRLIFGSVHATLFCVHCSDFSNVGHGYMRHCFENAPESSFRRFVCRRRSLNYLDYPLSLVCAFDHVFPFFRRIPSFATCVRPSVAPALPRRFSSRLLPRSE